MCKNLFGTEYEGQIGNGRGQKAKGEGKGEEEKEREKKERERIWASPDLTLEGFGRESFHPCGAWVGDLAAFGTQSAHWPLEFPSLWGLDG